VLALMAVPRRNISADAVDAGQYPNGGRDHELHRTAIW
jgi:hypothetical protein